MDKLISALQTIQDICETTKYCEHCRFSSKYYVNDGENKTTRYYCVLSDIPWRWNLEMLDAEEGK